MSSVPNDIEFDFCVELKSNLISVGRKPFLKQRSNWYGSE